VTGKKPKQRASRRVEEKEEEQRRLVPLLLNVGSHSKVAALDELFAFVRDDYPASAARLWKGGPLPSHGGR